MMPERVLVTGGAGFVGANVVRRLVADGADVHVLLQSGSDLWRIIDVLPLLTVHEGSIDDGGFVDQVVSGARPALVYHLAAYGAYSDQRDHERMVAVNTLGTFHLLDALARHGSCRGFVHTGSSSEYGLKDHAPAEDELPEPNSAYAVTKYAATLAASLYARLEDLPACSVRLYSVFGAWEEPTRLVPQLVARALDGHLPPLTSPATARDFVAIDDAVDGILLAAGGAATHPGAVWNIGSGIQTSLGDLVDLVIDEFGLEVHAEWGTMSSRAWDTDRWVADAARAREQLGWSAQTSLRAGLRRFADWMREAPARERYS